MANKKNSWIIWSVFGIIVFAVLAAATTTLSSVGVVTINGTFSQNLNVSGNSYINGDLELTSGTDGIIITSDGGGSYGTDQPLIHLKPGNPMAKPDIAWDGYYDNGTDVVYQGGVGWLVCHYNTSLNSDVHQHCSFETYDTDNNNLNTRFAIEYGKSEDDLLVYVNKVKAFRLNNGVDFYTKSTTNIFPENQEANGLNISIYNANPQLEPINGSKIYLNTDLLLKDTNADIKGGAEIDIYPYDGSTGFRLSTDTSAANGVPRLTATGSSVLEIADSLSIIGGLEVSGLTNITFDQLYVNGDASNQDSYIYMWDQTASTFQSIMFDKYNWPGIPKDADDTGFVMSTNVYVDGNIETSNSFAVNGNQGITGNYSLGICWQAASGGIIYATNCTVI